MTDHDGLDRPEPVGALLRRLRQGRGWSQRRLAEELCTATSTATVSRHEVSRWERGDRVPGPFWLGWLAVALGGELAELEAAAVHRRERRTDRDPRSPRERWLWAPPTGPDLLATLDHGADHHLPGVALAWLAGPPERARRPTSPGPEPDLPDDGTGRDLLGALQARLHRLRRADDLVGGADLVARVDRWLRQAIRLLPRLGAGRLRQPALWLVAGYAQLAGWVRADAGAGPASRRAYRVALRAAAVAGDRELAAHVLGSLSALSLSSGAGQEALLLARTGLAGLPGDGSPRLRSLLLRRAALAAARCHERQDADRALAEAERIEAAPGRDPDWLYWLDGAELAAMTGWCLAMLDRPLRAVPRLEQRRLGAGRRGGALYGCWLARCYVDLGELERACQIAQQVRTATMAAGSVRAVAALRQLHPVLLRHREAAAVRRYARAVGVTGR